MSQYIKQANISDRQQQAIDWLVKLRSDEMTDDELCGFAEWLAYDHANSEAFSNAEILFDEMTMAALEAEVTIQSEQNSPSSVASISSAKQNKSALQNRRYSVFLIPAFAIAAIWLITVVVFFPQQSHFLDRLLSDYHTETGEIREIKLADGSLLLLNTNSSVSIEYTDLIRKVVLHHGQVRFSVAKDISRPFEVAVDNLNVRALGTVFQIYKPDEDDVTITVQEHAVAVSVLKEYIKKHNSQVTVKAGEQLHFQTEEQLPKIKRVELEQLTAWQKHRLIINDQPLSVLIAELERYQNGRIFVSDNAFKNLRVSGVFSLDNPHSILTSVCHVLDLKMSHIGVWSVLHR